MSDINFQKNISLEEIKVLQEKLTMQSEIIRHYEAHFTELKAELNKQSGLVARQSAVINAMAIKFGYPKTGNQEKTVELDDDNNNNKGRNTTVFFGSLPAQKKHFSVK